MRHGDMLRMKKLSTKSGFTLTEILIAVAILAIIIILILINLKTGITRAQDGRRKTDLSKIQKAFEENYNDKQCYPDPDILSTCEGLQLMPYMRAVPCDPVRKNPYLYVPPISSQCSGYIICAKLEDLKDPDIARIGCHPVDGCGWGAGYNYCVSVGLAAAVPGAINGLPSPTPTPANTPTPTPPPGAWACS